MQPQVDKTTSDGCNCMQQPDTGMTAYNPSGPFSVEVSQFGAGNKPHCLAALAEWLIQPGPLRLAMGNVRWLRTACHTTPRVQSRKQCFYALLLNV